MWNLKGPSALFLLTVVGVLHCTWTVLCLAGRCQVHCFYDASLLPFGPFGLLGSKNSSPYVAHNLGQMGGIFLGKHGGKCGRGSDSVC